MQHLVPPPIWCINRSARNSVRERPRWTHTLRLGYNLSVELRLETHQPPSWTPEHMPLRWVCRIRSESHVYEERVIEPFHPVWVTRGDYLDSLGTLFPCLLGDEVCIRDMDNLLNLIGGDDGSIGALCRFIDSNSSMYDVIEDRSKLKIIAAIVVVCISVTSLLDSTHFNGLDAETPAERLINRIYFVMATLSTVGYGDISPRSIPAKLIGILMMSTIITTIVI